VSRCCRELVRLYFEPPDTVARGKWATEGPKARAAWDRALGEGAPDPE
jgi:hypothetical protein